MNQRRFTLNSNPKDESSPEMMPSRAAALPIMGGLDLFSGAWNYATAAHLLRRAMFGPTHAQINQAVSDGQLPSCLDNGKHIQRRGKPNRKNDAVLAQSLCSI